MKLIIAEKPSLARNIADAIGDMKKQGAYFSNNEYIVTWAFGHLFSLCDIEDYEDTPSANKRWTMDNLPCFPEKFKFELKKDKDKKEDSGVRKQFETIKALCNRADVDTIINAGDADREGEIIVRLCIENSGAEEKAQKRLWLPDQTKETINEALAELKDGADYNNLAQEGFARTYIDWLYGVNLTRYATLKSGTLLRVGRVIVPIVKAIYDRDMAIRNFKSEKYYAIVSKAVTGGEEVELTSKTKFKAEEYVLAKKFCEGYNLKKAVVKSKKTKKDSLAPGKLYSLSKLQNVLGKKYKMSMAESLEIVQGLYEKGYLTYPRTNSEYLATAEMGKVKKIIENIKLLGYDLEFKNKKTIFDDSKIESHSALTPTYKIPKKEQLSEKEYTVYSTVMRRFAAVFCREDCLAEKTEIVIDLEGAEEFTLKGTVITQKGWMKYDDGGKKDKILPALEKGDIVNTNFATVEKETTPPKHYTIETLNNYLKNPFKEEKAKAQENTEEENDEADYKAMFEGLELGTEATRTGIIDNAKRSNYIALKKDVYTILPAGENLINSLKAMNIIMDKYKTAEVGKALKKIFKGEFSVNDGVEIAKKEISQVFNQQKQPLETDTDMGLAGSVAGKCPLCGENVVRTSFGYGCSGYKQGCKFSVNGYILKRAISFENVRLLLQNGTTAKIKGFVSPRTGKEFDAFLVLEQGKVNFKF